MGGWALSENMEFALPSLESVRYIIGREHLCAIYQGFSLVESMHWIWDLANTTAFHRGMPQMPQLPCMLELYYLG